MGLYEVGAHRGNSRTTLNPKLRSKVHSFDNGIAIIDLAQTLENLENIANFMQKLGSKKKQVLFVGTSKHIKAKVQGYSALFKGSTMPFVNKRYIGGTFSNWATIKKTLKTLEKLESIQNNADFFKKLARKEQLSINKEQVKINATFGGLRHLKTAKPAVVIVLDAANETVVIKEAQVMGIPIICLTNTSILTLPKDMQNTLVFNINSSNAVDLIMNTLSESYNSGLLQEVIKEERPIVVNSNVKQAPRMTKVL
jgi:small subunit ribosomal protein S2